MIRLQLLVNDDGNRRALASLLEQQYTVETGEAVLDLDAFLVDDRSLPDYRDALVARKEDARPAFVPILLLRRDDTNSTIELPDPESNDESALVDDIVPAPVDSNVLFQRLSNLLVRPEQSLSLAQQYRQTQADFRGLFQAIPDPAFVVGDDATVDVFEDAGYTTDSGGTGLGLKIVREISSPTTGGSPSPKVSQEGRASR